MFLTQMFFFYIAFLSKQNFQPYLRNSIISYKFVKDFTDMDIQDNNFKEFADDIRGIAQELQTIYSQAEIYYTSAVNNIIRSQSKDVKEIEHLLNYMLDFADNEKILASYRKLCRYYFDINPQATAEYIQSYKEMYDKDEKRFKSGYFKNNPIKF